MEVPEKIYPKSPTFLNLSNPEFVRNFRLWLTGVAMIGISSFVSAQRLIDCDELDCSVDVTISPPQLPTSTDLTVHPFLDLLSDNGFNDSLIFKKWLRFYWGEDTPELQMFSNWQKRAGKKEILTPAEDLLRGFDSFVNNGYLSSLKTIAAEQKIPFAIPLSLLAIESHFNPDAKSSVGASGIAQIMRSTAEGMIISHKKDMNFEFRMDGRHDDRNDVLKAIHFMFFYLRYNAQMAHDYRSGKKYTHTIPKDFSSFTIEEIFLAVEAYHAGMGNVAKMTSSTDDVVQYPLQAYRKRFLANAQYGIKMTAAYLKLVSDRPEKFLKDSAD